MVLGATEANIPSLLTRWWSQVDPYLGRYMRPFFI
ncbi:hypothetical protein Syn19_198 [Synechococcus phage Syn19]|uniref:Uncharacterized protein n=1 Tax=Synechococcus phage Syn19 TaxID=445684 RepID=E3SQG2_9CAUD|nr:hypothetical protein Syn19_198 [Synechococcus phage Syn19]ADO99360.1 hypothetical protein Syn19_198 [Synechococcus phage Syn19]